MIDSKNIAELKDDNPSPTSSAIKYRGNLALDEIKAILIQSKKSDEELKYQKKPIKSFYENQNELIDSLLSPLDRDEEEEEKMDGKVRN
jgi:hypothetical protein